MHNKCNVLESSRNHHSPPFPGLWKNCLPWKQSLMPKSLETAILRLRVSLRPHNVGEPHSSALGPLLFSSHAHSLGNLIQSQGLNAVYVIKTLKCMSLAQASLLKSNFVYPITYWTSPLESLINNTNLPYRHHQHGDVVLSPILSAQLSQPEAEEAALVLMPLAMTLYSLVVVPYFFITGGIIYDVTVEPPSVGSVIVGHGPYVTEGLTFSLLFTMGS